MKRFFKTVAALAVWVWLPAIASWGIMLLWNLLLPSLCGMGVIGYWQALGLFMLGQFMSGGFLIGFVCLGGILHACGLDPRGRSHRHWHSLSAEERKEFIRRRHEWFTSNRRMAETNSDGE